MWKDVTLVVPTNEVHDYEVLGVNVVGCPILGITHTRDFILERHTGSDKLVMLDDDLIIQRRRENGRITDCDEQEVYQAFAWLEEQLKEVAHAGFGARFLGYNLDGEYVSPGRMMYVLGYNTDAVLLNEARFGRGLEQFSTMEDFNMTLQLLTKGFSNRVSLEWRVAPSASNAYGGCSTWRDVQRQSESARRLAAMFPEVVSIRPKKKWQGMNEVDTMYDVTVQWKKALNGNSR
jgi:hypothetical protein